MQKLLLLSSILALFVIPVRAERRQPDGIGYRALLVPFMGFSVAWTLALLYVYPRL